MAEDSRKYLVTFAMSIVASSSLAECYFRRHRRLGYLICLLAGTGLSLSMAGHRTRDFFTDSAFLCSLTGSLSPPASSHSGPVRFSHLHALPRLLAGAGFAAGRRTTLDGVAL